MSIKKQEVITYAIIIIIGLLAAEHLNVVISGSMEPVLYRGDIVGIEKTDFLGFHEFDPKDVKVGDIVVYNSEWFPGPIIHRVISINETSGEKIFTIKGDHNPIPDPKPVRPEQIVARVITIGDHQFIIPKIGYVTIYLKDFWYQLLGINEGY